MTQDPLERLDSQFDKLLDWMCDLGLGLAIVLIVAWFVRFFLITLAERGWN